MRETKWILIVLTLTSLLAVIAFYVVQNVIIMPFGNAIAEYQAIYDPSQGKLVEEYIFHISSSGKYRMLYRVWKAPISIRDESAPIKVKSVVCPEGTIAYVKDFKGKLYVLNENVPTWIVDKIYELAEVNEIGCYFPNRIPAGVYKLRIEYEFYPPVEYDGNYYHLNIKFADEHIPYSKVDIRILIPGKSIRLLYVHVPAYNVERGEDYIRIYGSSLKNVLLEVELVFEKSENEEYKFNIEPVDYDVIKATKRANLGYMLTYKLIRTISYIALGINTAFPIMALILYLIKGKERKFTVPEYLSYVPNRNRKPWEVNLLFKADALTMDEDAFYATLLDLKRRGIIDIEIVDDDIIVKIVKSAVSEPLDFYERKVLEFIRTWGKNNTLSFKRLQRIAKDGEISLIRILANELGELLNTPYEARKHAEKYVEKGVRNAFIALAVISFMLLLIILTQIKTMSRLYFPSGRILGVSLATLLGQSIICAIPPSQVFGRWKKSFYKEKLEWDAFRNMLEDFAMIQKYRPEDLVIWKEWLIYGTALGVGENVVKAMKMLNIEVPEAPLVILAPRIIRSTYGTMVSRGGVKGGKGFGGGFGAGGGFGGGGGGIR